MSDEDRSVKKAKPDDEPAAATATAADAKPLDAETSVQWIDC